MPLLLTIANVALIAGAVLFGLFFSWAGWVFSLGFLAGFFFVHIWARLETGRWLGG